MDLHSAGHRRGVVAAPHAAAVAAGRDILAEGGNALEVMVTMAAAIAAVYPHMNHVGGDGFWLIREPAGRVRALMAAGPAGSNATAQLYRDHGHDEIPPRGPSQCRHERAQHAPRRLRCNAARPHRNHAAA